MFGLFGVTITGVKPIGNNKHIRLSLTKNNVNLTAVRFGQTAEEFPYRVGDTVDLAVKLERNEYMGQTSLSIQIRDIRPAGSDDETLFRGLTALARIRQGKEAAAQDVSFLRPDRGIIKNVYAYIKNNPGCRDTAEVLNLRLGQPPLAALKTAAALEALAELGLIERKNGLLKIVPGARAALNDSKILQALGYKET